MKNSKEWVRQQMVDEAADASVVPGTCNVADVTTYQVAKSLDCAANSALHQKVRDWRRRRQEETAATQIDMPPEAGAEFGGVLNRMTSEAKAVFVRTIQRVGSEFERSKTLRVVDTERRRDAAEGETDTVSELWRKTEAELSDVHVKIDKLENALGAGLLREERLAGRIEQRVADWAAALQRGDTAIGPGMADSTGEVAVDAN